MIVSEVYAAFVPTIPFTMLVNRWNLMSPSNALEMKYALLAADSVPFAPLWCAHMQH